MNDHFEREISVAIAAVRQAASLCRSVREAMASEALLKQDRSPVTVADFGSQALICRALAEAFPDDPVIAEEDAAELRKDTNAAIRDQVVHHVRVIQPEANLDQVCRWIDHGSAARFSDRFWTLDPIDGTKGFLRGGQYAVALALLVDGKIEVAVLACPSLPVDPDDPARIGTIFVARRGQGAFALGLDGNQTAIPIRVNQESDPGSLRFCESVESGHSAHGDAALIAERLGITQEPLRMDSQAKYGVVARGEAAIYLRMPTRADYREKIWDHAAGCLIVQEAGGMVTDIAGKPLEFNHGRELSANRGVIVTNGRLHEPVLAAIEGLGLSSSNA